MPFGRFQLYSILGAVPWAITWGVVGYLLGNNWPLLTTVMKTVGYGGLAVFALVAITFLVLRRRVTRL